MRRSIQQALLRMAVVFSTIFLFVGCRRKTEEIIIPTETVAGEMSENKASHSTVVPMQKPFISVTSTDGNIKISLPDDTWRVLENTEGKYVFSSPGKGSITITRNTEISGIRLPLSKESVLDYLEDMGDDISQMEVEQYNLTDIGTDNLKTAAYTVKNSKEGMHPYITAYLILHTEELYDVTALAEESDKTLLESLQRSVASLQVLNEDYPTSRVSPTAAGTQGEPSVPPEQDSQTGGTPAVQDIQQEATRTGQSIDLYDADNNIWIQVYELSNGEWSDGAGMRYYAEGAGQ